MKTHPHKKKNIAATFFFLTEHSVWSYLRNSRVPSRHLTGAVGLLLMGNFDGGGPLVQEAAGGVQAAVPHARLSLKVLTHAVAVVVVTHAGLLCRRAEFRIKSYSHPCYFSSQGSNRCRMSSTITPSFLVKTLGPAISGIAELADKNSIYCYKRNIFATLCYDHQCIY